MIKTNTVTNVNKASLSSDVYRVYSAFDWFYCRLKGPSPFNSRDLIDNSPLCLPYNSSDVSSENFVLEQLIIPELIFHFTLVTYRLDIVFILEGEILSWSLVGVRGLNQAK